MPYIGNSPKNNVRSRFYYTASASQTLFSGADIHGRTLAYQDGGYVDVYLNGVLLQDTTDYTATTKTSVTLVSGATAGDLVEIVAYGIFSVADTVSAASGGEFNGAVDINGDLTVDTNTLYVDSTNNRVGIGTSSLSRKFEINAGGVGNLATFTDGVATNFTFKTDGSSVGTFGTEAGSTQLAFMASGTERMRIDSSGRVTMPSQPAFWAYLNANWTSWTPNDQTQIVPFDQSYHNVGNHFSSSTGLFTCPVAGNYVFSCGVYVGVSSVEQIWLVKNGVRQPTIGFANAGSTGDRSVGTFIVRCSANDTIGLTPYANTSTASTVFANFFHTFFIGNLIG